MMSQNVPIMQMPKTWVLWLLDFLPIYRISKGAGVRIKISPLTRGESETKNISLETKRKSPTDLILRIIENISNSFKIKKGDFQSCEDK